MDKVYQPNPRRAGAFPENEGGGVAPLLSARANSPACILPASRRKTRPFRPCFACCCANGWQERGRASVKQGSSVRLRWNLTPSTSSATASAFLIIEIMGRHSNVVFVDGEGVILDTLKRVDAGMSSQRLVLPGLRYEAPPAQDKLCMLEIPPERVVELLDACEKRAELSKALLGALQGVSPVVCRELQYRAGNGAELFTGALDGTFKERLYAALEELFQTVRAVSGRPYGVADGRGKPVDFSFLPIRQYGEAGNSSVTRVFPSFWTPFYAQKDSVERMRVRSRTC